MSSAPPFIVHGFMLGDVTPAVRELLDGDQSVVIQAGRSSDVVALASRLTLVQSETLDDPGAITELAVIHAARLGMVAATTDIVPLKFGTFASSAAALSDICDKAESQVRPALARIAGKVEFGIRISARALSDSDAPPEAVNGRDYLRSRADKRARERSALDTRLRFAADVRDGLSAVCVAQLSLSDAARAQGALLLNDACLLDRGRTREFLSAVEAHDADANRLGLDLVVTGAWPAYSFVADSKVLDQV